MDIGIDTWAKLLHFFYSIKTDKKQGEEKKNGESVRTDGASTDGWLVDGWTTLNTTISQ